MKLIFASWNSSDKTDYAYQNFYGPLKSLADQFILFDPREHYFKYGKESLNDYFLKLVEKERPDYVFLTTIYDEFDISTFEKVRSLCPHTKLINFFSDDEWRFENYSKYLAPYLDRCITTYPPAYERARKLGLTNFSLMIYACNTQVYRKISTPKLYEVSFIGQPTPERESHIAYLIKKGIDVALWGKGWTELSTFSMYKKHYRGIAKDIVQVINQSKIALTFLMDDLNEGVQIKGRIAEVAGCGTFQIITDNPHTQTMLQKNKEAAYFRSKQDLVSKVQYYLKHESKREKIAHASYKKITSKYTWDSYFKDFFNAPHPQVPRVPPKKCVLLTTGKSRSLQYGLDRVISVEGKNVAQINDLLKSIKEEFIILDVGGATFSHYLQSAISSAGQNNPQVVIVDCMLKKKNDEIAVVRYHNLERIKAKGIQIPTSSLIYSNGYMQKNRSSCARILAHNIKTISLDTSRLALISLPLVQMENLPLRRIIVEPISLAKKYEIALFNQWYQKKYGLLMVQALQLLKNLMQDRNLFILSTASTRTLPYKHKLKNE